MHSRRSFLLASVGTVAWLAMGGLPRTVQAASPHVLPPLPYAENALEPIITANTIGFHYGRHHKGYVDNLNTLVAGTKYADLSLEQINLEKAKAMSYKTVQKEPKNPTYLDTYAWVLFKMKNYSESITYILQAVELDNYKSDVLLEHLGDVYFYLGEVDKAVYYWETALKIGKGSGKINEKILRKEYME